MQVVTNYTNDANIRAMAAAKAEKDTNYSRRHKLCQVAIATTPLWAGLASATNCCKINNSAILNSGKLAEKMVRRATVGKSYIKGAAARVLNGLKSAGGYAGYFAAGILAFDAVDKLAEKNEKFNNFTQNYKLTTLLGTLAGAFAIVLGAKKGFATIVKNIKPTTSEKLVNKCVNICEKFNNNKIIKTVATKCSNISKKIPDNHKSIIKQTLHWMPDIALLGGMIASMANNFNFSSQYQNNYNELKEIQLQAAEKAIEV